MGGLDPRSFANSERKTLLATKKNMQHRDSGSPVSYANETAMYVKENNIKLAILVPCYGGVCTIGFCKSLVSTYILCSQINLPVVTLTCNSDSLVTRARNNLVAKAMSDPDVTHIMFIDSDIIWTPVDLLKLLRAEKDIVGGVYPKKKYNFEKLTQKQSGEGEPEVPMMKHWMQRRDASELEYIRGLGTPELLAYKLVDYNINIRPNTNVQIDNNLMEVRHLATGFMMIRRHVLEKMFSRYREKKYIDDSGFLESAENDFAFSLFETEIRDKQLLSEDWLFCDRWTDMGGATFIDVSINLSHVGVVTYEGSVLTHLLTI